MQVCFWALYSVPLICVSVLCQYLTLWITVSFFSKKKKRYILYSIGQKIYHYFVITLNGV